MSSMQKSSGLNEWRRAFHRRRWAILYAVAGVLLATVVTALVWPANYRSSGIILIEQQELPPDMVRAAVSSYADERIQVITQRVMTTENLFRIIERYDLYPRLRRSAPREKIIKRMREHIDFHMISADVIDPKAGRPTKATIAFSVSFSNHSPELAARVANELVSLYLKENIESRKVDAANASTFLNDEADRISKEIDEDQAKLAKFKEEHVNDLPERTSTNITLMNHADDDLREVDTQVRSLDQQIVYLDAQLAQISPTSQVYTSTGERVLSPADRLKFLRTEYARVSAVYSPDHPDVIRLQREIEGLEQSTGQVSDVNDLRRQLQEVEGRLDVTRKHYAEDHPDVVRLQREVASLKAEIKKAESHGAVTAAASQPDNPAYIELKAEREGAVAQRAALQIKREDLKSRIADFETRLDQTPAVERDYAAMVRELDNSEIKYRDVRQKQMDARVSQNLEDEQKGERFTLIEPPVTPEQRDSPSLALIFVLGGILAIAAGVATMSVLESTDTSIRSRRDLERLLGVAPLAIVPWIETQAERLLRRRRQRYAVACLVVAVVFGVTMTHFFYRPLDLIGQSALRHLTG